MTHEIITITFGPCIDKSTTIGELTPDIKLQCSPPRFEPGGGGINVARAIKKLGGEAIAIYPAGGYSGKFLRFLLQNEGVCTDVITISAHTRENFIAFDEAGKKQYRFGMPATWLSPADYNRCLSTVEKYDNIKYIVASGSLPLGAPTDIFLRLARIANNKGARLVVDSSGEPLRLAIEEGVYFAKPNLKELEVLAGKDHLTDGEVAAAAKDLLASGNTKALVISMGPKGALLVTNKRMATFIPPKIDVKSTVGAGDSMVAGIVYGLSAGNSMVDSVKIGVACGSSATMNPGTELCNAGDAEKLFGDVKISEFDI